MALVYSSFYKYMVPDLPDCEVGMIGNALKRAARLFCKSTETLHEPVAPIRVIAFQGEYSLAHRESDFVTKLTPHRIRTVHVNGVEEDPNYYDLYQDSNLVFKSLYHPQTLDSKMLQCATTTKATYTDWTSISDGAFILDIGGTLTAIPSMDFTAVTSMDGVAHVIETTIRATLKSNTINVVWHIDNFLIYNDSGTMGYMTAPTSGTDISDEYCKGLEADADIGPYILCDLTFLPTEDHTTLPQWYLNRYWDAIVAGAMIDLLTMEKATWANPELAKRKYAPTWKEALEDAMGENFTEFKTVDVIAMPQDWVV